MQLGSAMWREADLKSPFDPLSAPAYLLIAAMVIVGLALCWALGFRISLEIFPQFFGMPLMSVLAGLGLRRLGKPNFATGMEVLGLFYLQGLAAFFLIAPLASVGAPLVDGWLAQVDAAIGFDWGEYARLTSSFETFFRVMYRSFAWQPAAVALTLYFTSQSARLWPVITAAIVALIITSAVSPLAPALGASEYYGLPSLMAHRSAPALLALRDGYRILDSSVFTALICIPSYHGAAAVIFTWACWHTKVRPLYVALNALMAASAISIGDHYLIDLIAGAAVGGASIWLVKRLPARNQEAGASAALV